MKKNKQLVFSGIILIASMLIVSPFMVGVASAAPETLKIGLVSWLGWPL